MTITKLIDFNLDNKNLKNFIINQLLCCNNKFSSFLLNSNIRNCPNNEPDEKVIKILKEIDEKIISLEAELLNCKIKKNCKQIKIQTLENELKFLFKLRNSFLILKKNNACLFESEVNPPVQCRSCTSDCVNQNQLLINQIKNEIKILELEIKELILLRKKVSRIEEKLKIEKKILEKEKILKQLEMQIDNLLKNSICSSINPKTTQSKIQNQVGVPSSLRNSVLNSINIRGNKDNITLNQVERQSSNIWGDDFYLRNQSDRLFPSNYKNDIQNNVPTRGSSTFTSITQKRPGSLDPVGVGVDVKHGSYARYLGKKRANNNFTNKNGPFNVQNVNNSVKRLELENSGIGARSNPAQDNKLFRFQIISNKNCC